MFLVRTKIGGKFPWGVSKLGTNNGSACAWVRVIQNTQDISIGHLGKYHNTLFCPPTFCISFVSRFSWDLQMVPREYTNNAYAKSWGTTKSIMVFFPKWPIGTRRCRLGGGGGYRVTPPRNIFISKAYGFVLWLGLDFGWPLLEIFMSKNETKISKSRWSWKINLPSFCITRSVIKSLQRL